MKASERVLCVGIFICLAPGIRCFEDVNPLKTSEVGRCCSDFGENIWE